MPCTMGHGSMNQQKKTMHSQCGAVNNALDTLQGSATMPEYRRKVRAMCTCLVMDHVTSSTHMWAVNMGVVYCAHAAQNTFPVVKAASHAMLKAQWCQAKTCAKVWCIDQNGGPSSTKQNCTGSSRVSMGTGVQLYMYPIARLYVQKSHLKM